MSYRAVFLDMAKADSGCIEEYLSQFYPSTADNFITHLEKTVSNIEAMPYMYPVYDDFPFFRMAIIDDYLLFYSVDDDLNLVSIHRIIHSKRNISNKILGIC